MTSADHETYARDLLSALANRADPEPLPFQPDSTKTRNAAGAMTAILCHKLSGGSESTPEHERNTTFEWKNGVFNCRNIADREYLWSNLRLSVAKGLHEVAQKKPVAYL